MSCIAELSYIVIIVPPCPVLLLCVIKCHRGCLRGLQGVFAVLFTVHIQLVYSTVGCQRAWGPPLQPGIVFNFLYSSQFTFLSAIKPVLCNMRLLHSLPNLHLSSNFEPGMFSKIWNFQPDRSSATRSLALNSTVVIVTLGLSDSAVFQCHIVWTIDRVQGQYRLTHA